MNKNKKATRLEHNYSELNLQNDGYNENLLHEFANNYMDIMKSKYKDLKGDSLDDFLYDYENVLTTREFNLGNDIVQLF